MGSRSLAEAERRKLEDWVRLRLSVASSDATSHVIAATARLTEAGMDTDEAVDTVRRIADELNDELNTEARNG